MLTCHLPVSNIGCLPVLLTSLLSVYLSLCSPPARHLTATCLSQASAACLLSWLLTRCLPVRLLTSCAAPAHLTSLLSVYLSVCSARHLSVKCLSSVSAACLLTWSVLLTILLWVCLYVCSPPARCLPATCLSEVSAACLLSWLPYSVSSCLSAHLQRGACLSTPACPKTQMAEKTLPLHIFMKHFCLFACTTWLGGIFFLSS